MKSVSPIRKCEFCFLNFCIFVFPPLLCSEPLAEALTFDVFQVQWFSSGMRSCFSLSSQLIKLRSNFVRGPQTNNLLLSVCLRLRFHSRGLKGRVGRLRSKEEKVTHLAAKESSNKKGSWRRQPWM